MQTPEINIDIIIIGHNDENYYKKAIYSAEQQQGDIYTNIVVVDNGSTDSSVERLNRLKERFNFSLICQKEEDYTKALNSALKLCNKKDILFIMEAKTLLYIDSLELIIKEFKNFKDKVGYIYSGFYFTVGRTNVKLGYKPENLDEVKSTEYKGNFWFIWKNLEKNFSFQDVPFPVHKVVEDLDNKDVEGLDLSKKALYMRFFERIEDAPLFNKPGSKININHQVTNKIKILELKNKREGKKW